MGKKPVLITEDFNCRQLKSLLTCGIVFFAVEEFFDTHP